MCSTVIRCLSWLDGPFGFLAYYRDNARLQMSAARCFTSRVALFFFFPILIDEDVIWSLGLETFFILSYCAISHSVAVVTF